MNKITKRVISAVATFVLSICSVVGVASIGANKNVVNASANNVFADFTESDTKYLDVASVHEGKTKHAASNFSYVTDVDTNGDGVIDAANALKITGWNAQWMYFGLQFTNPIAANSIGSMSIRLYGHFGSSSVKMNFKGVNDNYTTSLNPWQALPVDEWTTIEFSDLSLLADENGMIDRIGCAVAYSTAYEADAYCLIDSITYTASVTLDNDTATTGVANSSMPAVLGEKMARPGSQAYGYNVEWYADAEKTQLFDFNTIITQNTTLYGKYTPVSLPAGTFADFNGGDARYLDLASVHEGKVKYPASGMSYVTDVDTNGDGVVDAANALKMTGWNAQWMYFGIEFAKPIAANSIGSMSIRLYGHFGSSSVKMNFKGVNDNYTTSLNPWQALPVDEWTTIEFSDLSLLADENGMIDRIGCAVAYSAAYEADAYCLIDSITYTSPTLVLDYDTQNTGIPNDEIFIVIGETIEEPISPMFGYNVEWYVDAARTQTFDFNTPLTGNMTLYAKFTKIELPLGLLVDFNGADAKYLDLKKVCEGTWKFGEDHLSYVTDVDTDGDGKVDAKNALKVVGWGPQWVYFAMEFACPVDIKSVGSITIRYYSHLSDDVKMNLGGEGDGYSVRLNPWAAMVQDEWIELEIKGTDLARMAGEDGKIDSLGFSYGYDATNAPYYEDAYFLIDSITYGGALTLDNDTENTGVKNTILPIVIGETLEVPVSQVFGYTVEWYADAERTELFDFNSIITGNTTLYGKYSPMEVPVGIIADFNGADSKYLELGGVCEGTWKITSENVSYVTNVDTNGDGIIEAENALKIVGFGPQWLYFGLEFASNVSIENIGSVTIRYYSHMSDNVKMNLGGEGDGYKTPLNPWVALPQEEWTELEISGDMLALMANEEGYIKSLGAAFGFSKAYYEDAFLLIDSITYTYNCTVTYDYNMAETGIENTTEVVQSGKKLSAPKSTREGYDVEWYKDAERTIPFDFKTERVSGDITLYAKYTVKQLTVTFDYDEATTGIEPAEITISYGEKVSKPDHTLEGYAVEWYVDAYYTELFDFENTEIKDNITIYAKYTSIGGGDSGNTPDGSGDSSDSKPSFFSCKSSIGLTAMPMLGLLLGATYITLKKKED